MATPVPTASPAAFADTLRVGWNSGPPTDQTTSSAILGFRGWLLSATTTTISLPRVLYSTLYRYDAHYNVVPDLADGPCAPQGDGTVLRCRIVVTTFHDGTPLTADDVAYSYRVWTSSFGFPEANLKEVRVVDPRTVDFALSAVDATFMTEVLPSVPIFSQRDVEARAADFTAATTGLSQEDLVALADTIDEELGRDPPLCSTRLDEMDALFAKLGARCTGRTSPPPTGRSTPAPPRQTASYLVRWNVAEGLGSAGYDAAMAALVGSLWFRPPVGTDRTGSCRSPWTGSISRPGPATTATWRRRRPRLRADQGGRVRPRGWHGRRLPVVLRRQCLPAVGGLTRRRGRDPANARVHRALLQRPGRAALRRAKPPAGAPAVHRPAAGRRRGDRRQRNAGLRAGPLGELGRRPQPAEAAAGHGGREAAHRGSRLDARDGRRLREGRRPPDRRHRDAG